MKIKFLAGISSLALLLGVTQARADEITFLGLAAMNQANSGPYVIGIPSTYQPLQTGYAGDGAADGITINWGAVADNDFADGRLGNLTPLYGTGTGGGILFTNGGAMNLLEFSAPVNLTSISYSNYFSCSPAAIACTISVTGYTDNYTAGDTNVAGNYSATYSQATGSNWITASLTGLNDVESLLISGNGNLWIGGLGLVTTASTLAAPVPEPSSIAMLIAGGLMVLGFQRTRSRS